MTACRGCTSMAVMIPLPKCPTRCACSVRMRTVSPRRCRLSEVAASECKTATQRGAMGWLRSRTSSRPVWDSRRVMTRTLVTPVPALSGSVARANIKL